MKFHVRGGVLVTGATSGIGREIARLFAQDGHELVIVGHDLEGLEQAHAEFLELGASQVHIVEADLMMAGGPLRVERTVRDMGVVVDVLVNAAGAGEYGGFAENDLEKELDVIQLNVASLVHLTKIYVQGMMGRKHGLILNLASVSSYQPTPLLTVYAATKAFVLSFSDALREEFKDKGVNITTLIPGATNTDFFRKAGMEHVIPLDEREDPKAVARMGYEALFSGEAHAVAADTQREIVMSLLTPNETVAARARKQMEADEEKR